MLASLILLALNFLGTWYLETTLTAYYKLELFVIGIMILWGIVLISAESQKVVWTWKSSTVYYSLSILNLTLLFLVTNNFVVFGLTTIVALIGLLRSVAKIDELKELPPVPVKLETYHAHHANDEIHVDPVMWVHPDELVSGSVKPSRVKASSSTRTAKKTSRRKSTRKKSSGKKITRKTTRKKSSRKKTTRKASSRKKTARKKSSRKKTTRKKSTRKKSSRRR